MSWIESLMKEIRILNESKEWVEPDLDPSGRAKDCTCGLCKGEEGSKVVGELGEMTPTMLSIFTLLKRTEEEGETKIKAEIDVKLDGAGLLGSLEGLPSMSSIFSSVISELQPIKERLDVLRALLWMEVRQEINYWEDGIGFRGRKIVSLEAPRRTSHGLAAVVLGF